MLFLIVCANAFRSALSERRPSGKNSGQRKHSERLDSTRLTHTEAAAAAARTESQPNLLTVSGNRESSSTDNDDDDAAARSSSEQQAAAEGKEWQSACSERALCVRAKQAGSEKHISASCNGNCFVRCADASQPHGRTNAQRQFLETPHAQTDRQTGSMWRPTGAFWRFPSVAAESAVCRSKTTE